MLSDDSKRIVVIKDIHSNIIEEAILILKDRPAARRNRNKDFILSEANMIISRYVEENKGGEAASNKNLKIRKKPLQQKKAPVSLMINVALAASAVLLLFLLSKAIWAF
ncbi:hypothetical protein DFR58_11846 [Anaerobacterium chartisolvens]|uniref:Uncharacterized protein n=1 Tax=Anaerobacterium chartisolvens TaxID=1297424 RepID=A0A369AY31_9FIRM|nr:hypothetical protein [Anaerobacterium chartisolvens]RCX13228.1 hypothetical protein DFR58_11846 [Anaerobacterium chartisolvens]